METHDHSQVRWLQRTVGLLCLAVAIATVLGGVASMRAVNKPNSPQQTAALRKIAPWVTQNTAGGQQAQFMAVLADQADLSQAAALPTKAEKGRFVYDTLLSKSRTTQAPIQRWLRERGIQYQSFYRQRTFSNW